METLELQKLQHKPSYVELEHKRDVSSVLLLREMSQTNDLYLRRELFDQAADQEASHISEVLEGSVITDYEFTTRDGRLYLRQPHGVTDWLAMHRNGVERAKARAEANPWFAPYVQIAEAELAEAKAQEDIVKAGRPAVMGKLSLCGSDVMSPDQLKQIGRDPDLQRSYIRFSVFDGQKLHLHSRSIDGVNLTDGRRGITSGWGAWENRPIELPADASSVDIVRSSVRFDESNMSIEAMHGLADKAVAAFDSLQKSRTGKDFKAGRCPEGVNTYKFIMDNQDLFNAHMEGLMHISYWNMPDNWLASHANGLRYDIMSSFKQRIEGTWIEKDSLPASVAQAGDIERQAGTQFSGCDTVIGVESNAGDAGYLNVAEMLSSKCVTCRFCKKTVDLPEQLLKEKIMHCTECKASVHTEGKPVDQEIIDRFYGKGTKQQKPGVLELVTAELAKYDRQLQQKATAERLKEQKAA